MDAKATAITLRVELGTCWKIEMECLDTMDLDELHFAIQQAVEFDNDHQYEFYSARGERNNSGTTYLLTTQLRKIFPLKHKHHLYYLFDYGDCWRFKISPTRKKPKAPVDGVEYPVVTIETGEKPEQYPTWY